MDLSRILIPLEISCLYFALVFMPYFRILRAYEACSVPVVAGFAQLSLHFVYKAPVEKRFEILAVDLDRLCEVADGAI